MERYVGVAPEVSFSPPNFSNTIHFIEPSSVSLDSPRGSLLFHGATGTRDLRTSAPSAYIPSGSMETVVDLDSVGSLLRGVLGLHFGVGTADTASTTLTADAAIGDTELSVGDGTGFSGDDYIQVGNSDQDPELGRVTSDGVDTTNNTLTLTEPVLKSHSSGHAVSEVTAPFTHSFKRTKEQNLPSYTYYIGSGFVERYFKGVTINRLAFTQQRELLTVSADLLAAREYQKDLATFSKSYSNDIVGLRYISYFQLENPFKNLKPEAEAFSIEINNNIDENSGIRFGSRFPTEFEVQGFDVTGSFTLAFRSLEQYQNFWGATDGPDEDVGTTNELTIEWGRNSKSLRLNIPKLQYESLGAPISGRDRLTQEIGYRGLYQAGADSSVVATLINSIPRH